MRLTRDDTVLMADGKEIARLYSVKGVDVVCAPLWADDDTWPAMSWDGDVLELDSTSSSSVCS